MPESTLALTRTELRQETAQFLGLTRTEANWGDDVASVDAIVKSGLRLFYMPPGLGEDAPHLWSFLVTTGTNDAVEQLTFNATTTAGAHLYDLNDDFGGIIGDMIHQHVGTRVTIVSENHIRALRSQYASASAVPQGKVKYAAIQILNQKSGDGFGQDRSQRYKLVLHPVPDGVQTLTFRYLALPDTLDGTLREYPLGGAQHAETIKAACIAVAELEFEDRKGPRWERFLELLRQSIAYDVRIMGNRTDESPWPISGESTTLDQSFNDIATQVGGHMYGLWDRALFSPVQERQVFSIIQSGLRQLNMAHDWKYNKPLQELTVNNSAIAFDLPDDFGTIIGELTFKPAA